MTWKTYFCSYFKGGFCDSTKTWAQQPGGGMPILHWKGKLTESTGTWSSSLCQRLILYKGASQTSFLSRLHLQQPYFWTSRGMPSHPTSSQMGSFLVLRSHSLHLEGWLKPGLYGLSKHHSFPSPLFLRCSSGQPGTSHFQLWSKHAALSMTQGTPESCPGTGDTQKQAFIWLQWLFFHRRFTQHYFQYALISTWYKPSWTEATLSSLICPTDYPHVIFTNPPTLGNCPFAQFTHQVFRASTQGSCVSPPSSMSHRSTHIPTSWSASDTSCRKPRGRIWKEGDSHLVVWCALFKGTAGKTCQKLSWCHEC